MLVLPGCPSGCSGCATCGSTETSRSGATSATSATHAGRADCATRLTRETLLRELDHLADHVATHRAAVTGCKLTPVTAGRRLHADLAGHLILELLQGPLSARDKTSVRTLTCTHVFDFTSSSHMVSLAPMSISQVNVSLPAVFDE
jgi:hypothetical protein